MRVISGPAEVEPPAGAEVLRVQTALEMGAALHEYAAWADVVIGAAAVADYRVEDPALEKRKRQGGPVTLKLVENPDLIAEVAAQKRPGQVVVGFAAETERLDQNATRKLEVKGADLIVGNDVSRSDIGFGALDNAVVLYQADREPTTVSKRSKRDVAVVILDRVSSLRGRRVEV